MAMIFEPGETRCLRIWLPAIRAGSGADVFTVRLAEALSRAGHEPLLQWFDHRYELVPWLLSRIVAPPRTDLVHAGSWQGFAFKRAGIPLVVTEHIYAAHPAFSPHRSFLQTIYHRLLCERWAIESYKAADAVVAVSEYCAQAMRRDIGKPIKVIHNWIDTSLFSPGQVDPVEDIDQQKISKPFKLLFVGNPSRWKGADLLPEIAAQLGSDFEILCIGGLRGDLAIKHAPKNLKLHSRVTPEQMPAIYQSVDAALVPTRYEAFGYIALEAMACGRPVVGFSSSGTAEVCVHGKTALLAPMDDVPRLVAYARHLANDKGLATNLGEAGRLRAMACFGEGNAVESYLAVYRDALKMAAGRSSGTY